MNRFGQPWRIATSFAISVILNGFLLTIDFFIDPRQRNLSIVQKSVVALLRPAESLTESLTPGHGGGQILALVLFSVLLYTLLAWLVLSIPIWWRHRA
jgi:hypothetical protein